MAKLTAKQQRFVDEYLIDLNATQAAIRAGYSEKTAMQQGAKLSKNPEIIAYIEKLTSAKKLTSEKLEQSNPIQVVKVEKIESGPEQVHGQFVGRDEIAIGSHEDPLEYLKSVWMDKGQDEELRVACAKAALPYVHGKVADKGKKQTKAEEAQNAAKGGGKFGTLGSQLRS